MQTLHFSNKTHSKILHIPSFGVALVLLICLASPTSSCTEQEKHSLLQFLHELSQDGGLATSWRNGTDCCNWKGIACRQDGTVSDVMLASKGLEGHISESLGNLTGLQHLNLSHNSLSGRLPLGLVSSSNITILDVSFNQLNGTLNELPPSTTARPLEVLNISSNLFAGQFPSTTWKAMENLIALHASNNSFTGPIPADVCNTLSSLIVLDLSSNQLSGNIPPGFGNCTRLIVLNASNNSFTGPIPADVCNTLSSLMVLDLSFNQLSGNIPPGIGNCTRLRFLRAGYNKLNGTLPDDLFDATLLEQLSFPNNDLHGGLDSTRITNLRNLVILDLAGNKFGGMLWR